MKIFNQNGFTLLEVLIAVTITAIIGVGASQLLATSASSKNDLEQRSREIKNIQRMDIFLRKDFSQLAGRKVKNAYGDLSEQVSNLEDNLIDFTYSGVPQEPYNPNKKQSNMLRAGYAIKALDHEYCEGSSLYLDDTEQDKFCFVRIFWPVLDITSSTEPVIQLLLDSVNDVTFRFKGLLIDPNDEQNSIRSNEWQEDWPPISYQKGMLADLVLIKVIIDTDSYGQIERVFEVPRYEFQK